MARDKKEASSTINELAMQSNVKKCWYDDSEKLFHCILKNGVEWTSENGVEWTSDNGDEWERVPEKGAVPPASVRDVTMDTVRGELFADLLSQSPWGDLPPTQQKIHEILGAMTDLLLYKNQKYGDSALNPLGIFTKHIKGVDEKTASILVRIDDKLSRVKNADTLRTNDICDLIGYLTLLNIAIGTTAEDIAKFKD